jgi:hypothetical protein
MKISILCALFVGVCMLGCSYPETGFGTEVTGIPGSITKFAVHQGFLYGLNQNEIQTYSLADPDYPKLVHQLPTDYGLETITVYDGVVYIGSTDGLYIVDIMKPDMPKIASKTERINFFTGCDPVVVKGNYAYSTVKVIVNACGNLSSSSQLIVFDVTDKRLPREVGRIPLDIPNGLGVSENHLFVCDEGSDLIEVLDITEQAKPKTTVFSIPLTDPVDVIVTPKQLIASTKTSFVVYDIKDITSIKRLATIEK